MSNTTTSLLVINHDSVNALVNRELRQNVTKMIRATAGMNKDVWTYALAVHNIIAGELHKDDFKNLDAFAKAMDTSKATLSKYDRAVETIIVLGEYGYDMTNMTYANAYLLGTLGDDFTAFMDLYHDSDLGKMTKSQLEEIIKKFKNKDVVAEVTDDDGEEPTEGELLSKGEDVLAYVEDGYLYFEYAKKLYSVPMDELKEYIVEYIGK